MHVLFLLCLSSSAGQSGPVSTFFNNTSNPQHKDAGTLGRALFDNESFEAWGKLYEVNTFSIFFVTTAFLGLLAKGSDDIFGYSSSVINITSISGIMKLAQEHVRFNVLWISLSALFFLCYVLCVIVLLTITPVTRTTFNLCT